MAGKKGKTKRVTKVDFDDEESVLRAMAKELDIDVGDLTIEEDSNMASFTGGRGTFYQIELTMPGEARSSKSWTVARNEDEAFKLAVAIVKQDLEESPENFEQNFIESHIDKERLKRDLSSDVHNMKYEDLEEEAERRPIEFMKEYGIEIPSPTDKQMRDHAEAMGDDEEQTKEIYQKLLDGDNEDRWIELGEEPEVSHNDIDEIADRETEEALKDPVEYLTDMMGQEDGVKKAIEIGGIDIDEAADEAVRVDGEGHFLSHYDGNISNGPDGIVYWRTN